MHGQEKVTVSVSVTNTGEHFGKDVVQLYVKDNTKTAVRPEKELKGFCKVALEAGETKTITFELDERSLSYYNESLKDWYAASGTYTVCIGHSSREIALETTIEYVTEKELPFTVDMNTCLGDILAHPVTAAVFHEMMKNAGSHLASSDEVNDTDDLMMQSMMDSMPFRNFKTFVHIPTAAIQGIIDRMNEALETAKNQ